MSDIAGNITLLKQQLPSSVKLVAVSKTMSVYDILIAYNTGQRYFGENRVQELLNKIDHLPGDIKWHVIGHLQTNKVKSIVPFVSMVQSVDSYKLLKTINLEAKRNSLTMDCLFQIHIAMEETKFGFNMNELEEMIKSQEFAELDNIRVCGVMGMATFTYESVQVRKEFRYLADCFKDLKSRYFASTPHFKEISMGMSGDFEIALSEGSTLVRIGSLIFGERNNGSK